MRPRTPIGLAGLLVVALAAGPSQASEPAVGPDCTFAGHRLWGKVQFVDSFADVNIKIVDAFPDLKVKKVDAFADACGEWKVVESFPDVKVKVVESFPDVKVKLVESFPGLP